VFPQICVRRLIKKASTDNQINRTLYSWASVVGSEVGFQHPELIPIKIRRSSCWCGWSLSQALRRALNYSSISYKAVLENWRNHVTFYVALICSRQNVSDFTSGKESHLPSPNVLSCHNLALSACLNAACQLGFFLSFFQCVVTSRPALPSVTLGDQIEFSSSAHMQHVYVWCCTEQITESILLPLVGLAMRS